MKEIERPKILFLMSQNPDIDHLAPVAALLAETNKYSIRVLSYQKRVNFQEDIRVKYLVEKYGVRVTAISDYYPFFPNLPFALSSWRSFWGLKCRNTEPFMFYGINIKSIFYPRFHIFRISRYLVDKSLLLMLNHKKWGESLFDSENPSVVVIDHAFNTEWINSFINKVHGMSIPTISFPHSCFMFTQMWEKLIPDHTEKDFPWNSVIVESSSRVELLSQLGVPITKMYPLGCIRYTQWWIKRISESNSKLPKIDGDHRPLVVFFASGGKVTLVDQLNDMYALMLQYKNEIRFIVKTHERRNNLPSFNKLLQGGIEVITSEYNSSSLIDCSDYILITGSSVVNEAILKNKKIIVARFTTLLNTTYSFYKVANTVHSIDDLVQVFDKIIINEWKTEVKNSAIKAYLKNCVYGGHNNESELIDSCLNLFAQAAYANSVNDYKINIENLRSKKLSDLEKL